MRKNAELHRYLAGMAATFAGAWLTGVTGSMLPLAMGASVTLMCTAPLVRRIWAGKRKD
jgi:hypothetical protein